MINMHMMENKWNAHVKELFEEKKLIKILFYD